MIRSLVREVVGSAPYEKRLVELLKNGRDKRALKLAKRKVRPKLFRVFTWWHIAGTCIHACTRVVCGKNTPQQIPRVNLTHMLSWTNLAFPHAPTTAWYSLASKEEARGDEWSYAQGGAQGARCG